MEFAYHAKNQLTMLLKPYMLRNVLPSAIDYFSKNPTFAKEAVELARIGSMKPPGFEGQSGRLLDSPYNPLKWAGRLLDMTSDIMRVSAGRAFDQMAKTKGIFSDQMLAENTETNKRDFVSQLGQYNKASGHWFITMLRDLGIGPFAVAGSNYYMQSMKSLAFDPGVKAGSAVNQLQLRAEMVAKTATILAAVGVANYFMWGSLFGDDKTPLGAIKVGQNPNGRTAYFDLTSMIGLTRGLRQTGLLALMQGQRKGQPEGKVEDKMVSDVVHSLIHPAFPAPQFAYTAYTGKNTLGQNVAQQVSQAKTPQGVAQSVASGHAPPGSSQQWLNLIAAVKNANPLYATLSGANRPGQQVTPEEKAGQLMGPFGLKYANPPKKPAKK